MYAWFGILPVLPEEIDAKDRTADVHEPPALPSPSQTSAAWTATTSRLQPTNSFDLFSPAYQIPVQRPVKTASMKVLHLAIVKNVNRPAVDLCAESDLTSYSRFMRGSYSEMMGLAAATVAERTKPGQRQDIEEEKLNATIHAYGRTEGVCGIMITDSAYPALVAHQILSKIVDEFLNKNPVSNWINSDAPVPFPALKEYLVKYQNPEEADSIMKIQKELDETKIVLHKTIEAVLERGEHMDKLAADSQRLSFSTKAFAKQAQKQNSCCILM
ncbi:hypothetical protein FKW77_001991 [Venturia effusa]|uniref:Palmitoyltransferase n=1 Tax=Venturia effusa TaxID=50376 RepID=A0A517LI65_9PEZI|nr:hypothetical protein FKW77_001991 [Venturia effusa]